MEVTKRIIRLLVSYLQNSLEEQEKQELDNWVNRNIFFSLFFKDLNDKKILSRWFKEYKGYREYRDSSERMYARIRLKIDVPTENKKYIAFSSWIKYAAAFILIFSVVATIFLYRNLSASREIDLDPAINKAFLVTEDGHKIRLNESKSGLIVTGNSVSYLGGDDKVIDLTQNSLVSLVTPKGGTYQIMLSDGSKVWLNVDSKLIYPLHFSKSDRIVELSGEAYFEVAKDKNRPFKVRSKNQDVVVTGTAFNISAYPDSPTSQTTLIEGGVHVTNGVERKILLPGQQSLTSRDNIAVHSVDPSVATAWKNGVFYFVDLSLYEILLQAARWYDVEIVYEDDSLKKERFSGYILRTEKSSRLLSALEGTRKIHFTVEPHRIIVKKSLSVTN